MSKSKEEQAKKVIANADAKAAQEGINNLIKGGSYKGICKLHKAIFDGYVECGFSRDQSLALVCAFIGKSSE